MKNLIRNGGFERGTTDFWKAFDAQAFTADGVDSYKGSYNGKLVCASGINPYIMPNDYVEIGVLESLQFEAWIKTTASYMYRLTAVYYDEALSELEEVYLNQQTASAGDYQRLLAGIPGKEGAEYVRPKLKLLRTTIDNFMRIDNVQMYKFSPLRDIGREIKMEDLSGSGLLGGYYSDYFVTQDMREGQFVLDVENQAGSSITVDTTIESFIPHSGAHVTIATFNQVGMTPTEQMLLVTAGLGSLVRVKTFITGTVTGLNIKVVGNFKR